VTLIGSSGIFLVDLNLLEEARSVPQFQMMECGIVALDCNSPICEGSFWSEGFTIMGYSNNPHYSLLLSSLLKTSQKHSAVFLHSCRDQAIERSHISLNVSSNNLGSTWSWSRTFECHWSTGCKLRRTGGAWLVNSWNVRGVAPDLEQPPCILAEKVLICLMMMMDLCSSLPLEFFPSQ